MDILQQDQHDIRTERQEREQLHGPGRPAQQATDSDAGCQAEIGDGIPRSDRLPGQTCELASQASQQQDNDHTGRTPVLFSYKTDQQQAYQVEDRSADAAVLKEQRRNQPPPLSMHDLTCVTLEHGQERRDEELKSCRDGNDKKEKKSN